MWAGIKTRILRNKGSSYRSSLFKKSPYLLFFTLSLAIAEEPLVLELGQVTASVSEVPQIKIVEPFDGKNVVGKTLEILAEVDRPVDSIRIYVDEQLVKEVENLGGKTKFRFKLKIERWALGYHDIVLRAVRGGVEGSSLRVGINRLTDFPQ